MVILKILVIFFPGRSFLEICVFRERVMMFTYGRSREWTQARLTYQLYCQSVNVRTNFGNKPMSFTVCYFTVIYSLLLYRHLQFVDNAGIKREDPKLRFLPTLSLVLQLISTVDPTSML